MNKIIVIVVIFVAGWYGGMLYQQKKIPFFQDAETTIDIGEKTKCITADGKVLYGLVTDEIICERREPVEGSITIVSSTAIDPSRGDSKTESNYRCDGRQHCSQMTSRAEAEFFVNNCPNTKMDGDHDGIPCENDSRF